MDTQRVAVEGKERGKGKRKLKYVCLHPTGTVHETANGNGSRESENICRIAIRAIDLVCTVRRFGSDVDVCLELGALLSETFRFVQSGRLMLK